MDEIVFENGSVIHTIESKGENVRGKRAELKHWLYDYEMNNADLSFLDKFISKDNEELNNHEVIFMTSKIK